MFHLAVKLDRSQQLRLGYLEMWPLEMLSPCRHGPAAPAALPGGASGAPTHGASSGGKLESINLSLQPATNCKAVHRQNCNQCRWGVKGGKEVIWEANNKVLLYRAAECHNELCCSARRCLEMMFELWDNTARAFTKPEMVTLHAAYKQLRPGLWK